MPCCTIIEGARCAFINGLLVPGPIYRAILTRLRLRRGLCPACGYDLAGNTSGLCPECGTPKPA